MGDFFVQNKVSMGPERLQAIIAETDDDQSSFLDEGEFMVLLIKAMGLKKRKVGPGLCPLAQLKAEGWILDDVRRLGYECREILDAGFILSEILDVFGSAELRRAGVSLQDLLAAGWDCARGREAGFTLAEFVAAGCGVRKIRFAGWDTIPAAAELRKHGIEGAAMRIGA